MGEVDPEIVEDRHRLWGWGNSDVVSPAVSGLLAGSMQALVFNPYDRALYLSVIHNRDFLSVENWRSPFQGYAQAFFQRTLSGGLYFPLEDLFKSFFSEWSLPPTSRDIIAGHCAGAVNGLVLNPLSVVKHRMWSSDNAGYWSTARQIYSANGLKPFLLGAKPTILRDITFGGVYTSMRYGLRRRYRDQQRPAVFYDIFAAACATVASSPFNFIRNIHYSSSNAEVPNMINIVKGLVENTMQKPAGKERIRYAQRRLGIGWGTARVAMGIAFGAFVYETLTGTRKRR